MATVTPKAVYPVNSTFNTPAGAANAPTTPYSGTFIPTLWSGKLAKKFYDATVFGGIANTDWEGEIKNVGDTVIINTIPDITVKDYKIGQNLDYEVPEGETIELTVDRGSYFAFQVNDVFKVQSQPNLVDMFSGDAAEKMKDNVDVRGLYSVFFNKTGGWETSESGKDAAWTLNLGATAGARSGAYNLGTDSAPVALTGDNIVQYITMMSTVMDEANVPSEGRYLVLSPYERQLLMMSPLANAQFIGDSTSILRNGRIGTIDRFTIYVSNNLPRAKSGKAWDNTTSVEGANRHLVFAGHKSSITFASQISKTETLRNPNDFGDLVRGLNVWGMKVVQGQGLVPLVVADK